MRLVNRHQWLPQDGVYSTTRNLTAHQTQPGDVLWLWWHCIHTTNGRYSLISRDMLSDVIVLIVLCCRYGGAIALIASSNN